MVNICRLCLSTIPPSSIIPVDKNHPPLEEQIKYLLPEIDMDLTLTLNLCNICENLLQSAYSFICTCRQTEETIKNYKSQHNITPVNLNEVKKFQTEHLPAIRVDTSEDIKIEMHNVEIKSEIPRIQVMEPALVCHKCYKTIEDQQTLEQHQMGCFLLKCNQYEKVLRLKKENDEHCPSPSIPMASPINIDLQEVERSQIENFTRINDVLKDATAIPSQDLKIKTEFVNVDEINLSDKCHEQFEYETMGKRSKNSSFTEDLEVKPLLIEVNTETDINVRDQVNVPCIRNEHHKIEKWATCDICQSVFTSQMELQSHNLTHKTLPEQYCPTSPIQFKHEIDQSYKCQICNINFNQKSDLTGHIKCRHEIDRLYKCQTCSMNFKLRSKLKDHIKCKHEVDRRYKCQACDMSFNLKRILMDHIKYKHEIDKPHKCPSCSMGFTRKSNLTEHIKCRHRLDRPYKCQTCDMSFKRKSILTNHIKCKHGLSRPYKCPTCDMSFKQTSHLIGHIQSKHELDRPYKCQICVMSFKRKGTLTRHIQSKHQIDRPYKCKICDKSFAVPRALKIHIKTHSKPDEKFSSVHARGSNL